jgi:ribosomal protein S18 acetylase RimI-like enzyme
MITMQEGLTSDMIDDAVRLFLSAFRDKLTPVLGDDERMVALFKASVNPDSCLAASDQGRLVGLLAVKVTGQTFLDVNFITVRSLYGFFGAVSRTVMLKIMDHSVRPKELYVEAIAVDEKARGEGIGTKLIEEVVRLAGNRAMERVTLEVINTNPRALQLYQRLGFSISNRMRIWPVNRIFGWKFSEVLSMCRGVNQ